MTEPVSEVPKNSGLFMLGIESNPLPMQPDMFNLIGQIVIHWSRVEVAIDHDIEVLRRYAIVKKLAEVVPHTFSKKLELWRRSIRALYPKIDIYQRHADGFYEACKTVLKFRNHIIHGLWSIEPNDDGEFLVSNYRQVRGQWRYDTLWVGIRTVENLLADVQMLDNEIMSFTATRMLHGGMGLLQADVPASHDQVLRASTNPDEPPPASKE